MTRKLFSLLSMLALCGASGCASLDELDRAPSLSLEALAKSLAANADVVMLGEQHDNFAGHQQHLELVRLLHQWRPRIVVTMEMFERDVQDALTEYLADQIDEATFLERSRPWRNYARDYRPIVEWAKRHDVPVIAANPPTELARAVARGEFDFERSSPHVARETSAPRNGYWTEFVRMMDGHAGTNEDTIFAFYRSQCLKDDTMAESIVAAFEGDSPAELVVHVCGQGHVIQGHGVVERVRWRRDDLRVVYLTMEERPNVRQMGADHFVLVVPPEPPRPKAKPADSPPTTQPVPEAGAADVTRPAVDDDIAVGDVAPRGRPALGLMPDYDSTDGVLISMVVEGGPAETAGLQAGDVIVRLGSAEVVDVRSYMDALGTLTIGAEVEVIVDRGGVVERRTVKVGERP